MSIPERVCGVLEEAGLTGAGLLVALSGGLDSVCLVRLLAEATVGAARLEVAHVDHGARADSDRDAAFCRELAEELGLRFHGERLAPGALAGRGGFQAEARRHRRRFLEAVAAARGLGAVALGHHRDDQVETVLLRLARGTGPRGVVGMVPWAPPYLRPLLAVGRRDLEALAVARGWRWREDPSNQGVAYARNRVRHHLLPLLEAVHPGAREAILRHARLAAEDDRALTGVARRFLAEAGSPEPDGLRFSAAALEAQDPAVRRRVLLAAWSGVGGDPGALDSAHLDTVSVLLGPGRAHRRAPVPGPGAFVRSYQDLWVLAPGALESPAVSVALPAPGRVAAGSLGAVTWGPVPPPGGAAVGVPRGRGEGGIFVRTWQPGDRLVLSSRKAVKIKDLLLDARVPRWRRRRALLVGDARGPLGLLAPGRAWGPEEGSAGWVWAAP